MTATTALAWLNDLMQWLGRWVPRLVLVPPTHAPVFFGPGGRVTGRSPGLVVYWPITHQLVQVPMTTQSIEPGAQAHPSPQGEWKGLFPLAVVCGSALQFRVFDPQLAATRALSLHALVGNRCNAALARHFPGAIDAGAIKAWAANAATDLARELPEYGVKLERLDIVNVSYASALKQVSDWSFQDTEGRNQS